jgi:ornithine carbamoyltransferase
MLRTSSHKNLEEFGKYLNIPIINGLSDQSHPCQVLTDLFSFEEAKGSISGKSVAWLGDGNNNMSNSLIEAAGKFDFKLKIGCPNKYKPNKKIMTWAKKIKQCSSH